MTLVAHHADQSWFEKTTALAGTGFWLSAGRFIGAALITMVDWQERAMQRRRLLALSDSALKDLGRTRCDAVREGTKPFWQV